MRSPHCAPLLLLLLLPPLLLTPPAGDAAVITGVSGRAHLSAPGAPARRPRSGEGNREGEARGTGRVAPRGDACLRRPLALRQVPCSNSRRRRETLGAPWKKK